MEVGERDGGAGGEECGEEDDSLGKEKMKNKSIRMNPYMPHFL